MEALNSQIIACCACSRLRSYCEAVAQSKRRAYSAEPYWGRPVPGFGDIQAQLVLVGLAPGAHGANRTGRVFTGDRSGDWLYQALFESGFANQPESQNDQDGLQLLNAYITCGVKCAPPGNKPTLSEQKQCASFLRREVAFLHQARVWVALGQWAFRAIWPLLEPEIKLPLFRHGAQISLSGNRWLLLSYHPSQQNTFTGKLTRPMFQSIFTAARELLQ